MEETPILEPLTGMLTAYPSRARLTRQCLTCEAQNKPFEEVCEVCKRPLVPEWMRSDGEQGVFCPGAVVKDNDSLAVGVITAARTVPAEIEIQLAKEKGQYLENVVVPAEQIKQGRYELLFPEDGRCTMFGQFSLCAQCHRTYRVPNAREHAPSSERQPLKRRLKACRASIEEHQQKKAYLKMYREKKQEVLQCTAEIKNLQTEILDIEKSLAPLQLWCPYCLWKPEDESEI